MNIKLSPSSHANAKQAAEHEGKTVQVFVMGLLENILHGDSFYVVMRPRPDEERLKAMHYAMNSILNVENFYGFKMLSKEEYEAAQKEAMKIKMAELIKDEVLCKEAQEEEESRDDKAPEQQDAEDNENTINVRHRLTRVK